MSAGVQFFYEVWFVDFTKQFHYRNPPFFSAFITKINRSIYQTFRDFTLLRGLCPKAAGFGAKISRVEDVPRRERFERPAANGAARPVPIRTSQQGAFGPPWTALSLGTIQPGRFAQNLSAKSWRHHISVTKDEFQKKSLSCLRQIRFQLNSHSESRRPDAAAEFHSRSLKFASFDKKIINIKTWMFFFFLKIQEGKSSVEGAKPRSWFWQRTMS